jgi:hypothetical protein
MRSYGETEERMQDLRAIFSNFSNFEWCGEFVHVCSRESTLWTDYCIASHRWQSFFPCRLQFTALTFDGERFWHRAVLATIIVEMAAIPERMISGHEKIQTANAAGCKVLAVLA